MKISEVRIGIATRVNLVNADGEGFGAELAAGCEIRLCFDAQQAILSVANASWNVAGFSPKDRKALSHLNSHQLPNIAWLIGLAGDGEHEKTCALVEVRQFAEERELPEALVIGIDEKSADAAGKRFGKGMAVRELIRLLEEEILIGQENGDVRVLVSGGASQAPGKAGGYRFYGKTLVVDVMEDRNKRLLVHRIVWSARPTIEEDLHRLVLVRGRIGFTDASIAGEMRSDLAFQMSAIRSNGNSYLDLWEKYNDLEMYENECRAKEIGYYAYTAWRIMADGNYKFLLESCPELEGLAGQVRNEKDLEFEAAERPPDFFSIGESQVKLTGQKKNFVGNVARFVNDETALEMSVEDRGSLADPPPKGVLFLSLFGNRLRIKRRQVALMRITMLKNPMPQLGLLIENHHVPERPRKQEEPLSSKVREYFHGEPTNRQIEAIRVALNTPDIALVQGPPGTGKTRTIAAMIARFAEISETSKSGGQVLLSSFQHEAVENVANVTQIYGLPAIKAGTKRRRAEKNDSFILRDWREKKTVAIRGQLDTMEENSLEKAYRTCKNLFVSYLKAPYLADRPDGLWKEVLAAAKEFLPGFLVDRLQEKLVLSRGGHVLQAPEAQERTLALKALHSLRTDPVAFRDDGPAMSRKALLRLEKLGLLSDGDRQLLEKTADWQGSPDEELLSDLGQLRERQIACLSGETAGSKKPVIDNESRDLLVQVSEFLLERIKKSAGGVRQVLEEFLHDLENDPLGTEDTIKKYTLVLAATCQQSVSGQMKELKNIESRSEDLPEFETVIVDEAARSSPLDLLIPLSLAKRRIILVGDHRQLPQVIDSAVERRIDLGELGSAENDELLRNSLFEKLFKEMREREKSDGIRRTVTLDVQYRMHPVLGNFVSDVFYAPYGEGFASGKPSEGFRHGIEKYGEAVAAWVEMPSSKGMESGGMSKSRRCEARWIAREIREVLDTRHDLSIGVIAFYLEQTRQILGELEKIGIVDRGEENILKISPEYAMMRNGAGDLVERLRVGTVDSFQGKEFDIVYLSMTRSNDIPLDNDRMFRRKYGHLVLANRLCVAMSRQRRLLVVVGDPAMLEGEGARRAIPGLIKFHELCGGSHGIRFQS